MSLIQIPGWVRGQTLEDPAKLGWFDRLAQWINGYRFYVGSFTRDITTATGTQAVTGLPFRPSAVAFFAGFASATAASSTGFDDGDTAGCLYANHLVTADTEIISTTASIFIQGTAGNNYTWAIQSLDGNAVTGVYGFTGLWTKTGVPAGTATIDYLAFK